MSNTISRVVIGNLALFKLGEARISAFDDGSKAADILNEIYDSIRDEVLASHPWNFSIKRFELEASAQEPEWKWGTAFPLDEEILRVVETDLPDGQPWAVELDQDNVRCLMCDEESVSVAAVVRIEDETRFSPRFVDSLACRLAQELAFSMTGTKTSVDAMKALYEDSLAKARSADAQEGRGQRISASSWKAARRR